MSILDGFEMVEIQRNFSVSQMSVLKNGLSFNMFTASEMGYPEYVHVYINKSKTQIAIMPCQQTDRNAMRFFTAKIAALKRPKKIRVGNKALAAFVRDGLGLESGKVYSVPGIRITQEGVVLFDLTQCRSDQDEKGLSVCTVLRPRAPFYQVPSSVFSVSETVSAEVIEVI